MRRLQRIHFLKKKRRIFLKGIFALKGFKAFVFQHNNQQMDKKWLAR